MSQTIDLKVEYTNRLAQENEALRARVERLQNQVKIPETSDEAAAMALTGMNWLENNDKSKLTEFHNKYVAEIKARAGRDGFIAGANDAAAYIAQQINAGSSSIDLDTVLAADKYANQLRQQGEQK